MVCKKIDQVCEFRVLCFIKDTLAFKRHFDLIACKHNNVLVTTIIVIVILFLWDKIIHSNLQKVVISRKQKIDKQDFNALDTFKRLGSKYATAFVYLWYHPKVGMWLGATPESLLSINGRSFETVALAGTQPYSSGDVFWGAKEQEEQEH